MKEVLEIIAKALVDEPDKVSVTEIPGEEENGLGNVTLELRVAEDDMGKVIGKQGRIAKAIRTVVKAAASKENKHAAVEIL
ncbi:MAG: KH domain-containing protein [bacterium]|nr:KH domain-containing protein [bacterium]